MIRFVHTADLQIGKPFNWASGRARQKLKDAREEAIERVGEVAADHEADFIVIAGDLFDDNTVGDDVVSRTCQRLSAIDVPVFILPGNHDFAGGPACVYHRDLFDALRPDHVTVLDDAAPHVVEGTGVALLPAPVQRHSERGDPTEHLTRAFGSDELERGVRVGLAHGGVEDFGSGDAASRIAPDRAQQADLDYLALGDWHGCKQVNDRTWYSGTPEPDSFKQNDPGHALVVELEERGALPSVERVETGTYTWIRKTEVLHSQEDLEALERWFQKLTDPLNTLVRLELDGTLSLDAMWQLEKLKKQLEGLALFVRHRGDVRPHATDDEIDAIATDGYVREAVDRLRSTAANDGENQATGERALQLLYQLKHE